MRLICARGETIRGLIEETECSAVGLKSSRLNMRVRGGAPIVREGDLGTGHQRPVIYTFCVTSQSVGVAHATARLVRRRDRADILLSHAQRPDDYYDYHEQP